MVQHILPPALPARLEEAERGEELIDMARATEEAVADWRFCGLELSGGSLRDMRFERCEFSGCRFTGADLSRATFLDTVFKNCDFSAVRGESVYFCRCRWQGIKAMGAIFTDCRLVHMVLENCTLVGANPVSYTHLYTSSLLRRPHNWRKGSARHLLPSFRRWAGRRIASFPQGRARRRDPQAGPERRLFWKMNSCALCLIRPRACPAK